MTWNHDRHCVNYVIDIIIIAWQKALLAKQITQQPTNQATSGEFTLS